MSALQASRLYKVPSRTLYDKVKKLGIVGTRPMNRAIKRSPSNNGSPASFPYGISGTRSPLPQLEGQSHSQALNDSENGSELDQRERLALHISNMCDPNLLLKAGNAAFAAFAAVNGIKNIGRSMSPSAIYQAPPNAGENSPSVHDYDEENDDDYNETKPNITDGKLLMQIIQKLYFD